MRIAAISDIHGNLVALEAVLKDLKRQGADQVVCLGDLAFKGPWPGKCISRVRELSIPCIHGNTDLYLLKAAGLEPTRPLPAGQDQLPPDMLPYLTWHLQHMSREDLHYLAALPFEHRLEADGLTLQFVHACPQDVVAAITPTSPREQITGRLAGTAADWVIMGHIHQPFFIRFGGKSLYNTGAVGFSLDKDWRASYLVLDTARGGAEFHRVEYDIAAAVAGARERGYCFRSDFYEECLRTGWWEPIPWPQQRALDEI